MVFSSPFHSLFVSFLVLRGKRVGLVIHDTHVFRVIIALFVLLSYLQIFLYYSDSYLLKFRIFISSLFDDSSSFFSCFFFSHFLHSLFTYSSFSPNCFLGLTWFLFYLYLFHNSSFSLSISLSIYPSICLWLTDCLSVHLSIFSPFPPRTNHSLFVSLSDPPVFQNIHPCLLFSFLFFPFICSPLLSIF